jgi:hypothetical protein
VAGGSVFSGRQILAVPRGGEAHSRSWALRERALRVVPVFRYTVPLNFAENYFGGWAAPASPPRLFREYADHVPLLRDFDLSREAGGAMTAWSKAFRGIKPNSFDKIVLSFESSTEFAIVNAISVEDEGK